MAGQYDDLPTQGEHLDPGAKYESGQEVRVESAPDSQDQEKEPVASTFLLARNTDTGYYRLRHCPPGQETPPGEGFQEIGRYRAGEELDAAIQDLQEPPQFVVLEDSSSGQVIVDNTARLSADWTGGGSFDGISLFATEPEASAYADRRRQELGGG